MILCWLMLVKNGNEPSMIDYSRASAKRTSKSNLDPGRILFPCAFDLCNKIYRYKAHAKRRVYIQHSGWSGGTGRAGGMPRVYSKQNRAVARPRLYAYKSPDPRVRKKLREMCSTAVVRGVLGHCRSWRARPLSFVACSATVVRGVLQ